MPKFLPAITNGQIFWIFLIMNWYKPVKKIESTACKEENNLDYQPIYEDVSDNEDLPTGRFGSPVSDKEVAHASRKRCAI